MQAHRVGPAVAAGPRGWAATARLEIEVTIFLTCVAANELETVAETCLLTRPARCIALMFVIKDPAKVPIMIPQNSVRHATRMLARMEEGGNQCFQE